MTRDDWESVHKYAKRLLERAREPIARKPLKDPMVVAKLDEITIEDDLAEPFGRPRPELLAA